MKYLLLLIIILISNNLLANTCKDYITDEWPDTRYLVESISSDNVVTDKKTGLMWKQCSEGLTTNGCNSGSAILYNWQQALDIAISSSFAGFSNWRVPNKKELRTIVAINCYNPSINEIVFPQTKSLYWSSTPGANQTYDVWFTNFLIGENGYTTRDDEKYVRLVRNN